MRERERNLACVTALPERERKREIERERLCALGGEDLRPGGGGGAWEGLLGGGEDRAQPEPRQGSWRGGGARGGGRAERALPRERERERIERERERAHRESAEGSYRDRGGGLLQDRGSYRKNVWGIIFGGSTGKSCNSPGAKKKALTLRDDEQQ